MSGTEEALWFVPGGEYALCDEGWDPWDDSDGSVDDDHDDVDNSQEDLDGISLRRITVQPSVSNVLPTQTTNNNSTRMCRSGMPPVVQSKGEDTSNLDGTFHPRPPQASQVYTSYHVNPADHPHQPLLRSNLSNVPPQPQLTSIDNTTDTPHLYEGTEQHGSVWDERSTSAPEGVSPYCDQPNITVVSALSVEECTPQDAGDPVCGLRENEGTRSPDPLAGLQRSSYRQSMPSMDEFAVFPKLLRELPVLNSQLEELFSELLTVQSSEDESSRVLFPKVKAEYDRLKDKVDTMQDVCDKIKALPMVEKARKLYRKDTRRKGSKFTDHLFNSIAQGKLDDVEVLTAALDLEGRALKDMVEERSHLSVIHLALMREEQEIVEFLLKHSGKELARLSVQTNECKNLTPLYIAIQHVAGHSVKMLVESVPEVDRAGYINELVPNKAYAGTPYDEITIAGSVSTCIRSSKYDDQTEVHIEEMLKYLVENGLNLEQKTSTGNTILHLLVMQAVDAIDHIKYFQQFLRHGFIEAVTKWWILQEKAKGVQKGNLCVQGTAARGLKHLFKLKNKDNLTPLALAAKVESPLYLDIISWENVMRYPDLKMGTMTSNVDTYNVTNVTSLNHLSGQGHSYNSFSVMHVLAHNDVDLSKKVWNVDISCIEPLKSIIERKWEFYKWFFYLWALVHVTFMTTFTLTVFYHEAEVAKMMHDEQTTTIPDIGNTSNGSLLPEVGAQLSSGYIGPVAPGNPYFGLLMILPILYILMETFDFFCMISNFQFGYTLTGNALYRVLSITCSLFSLLWFLLHMIRDVNQDIVLGMALLFGWLFCIFFTRTINLPSRTSQIGAFSIMVQRMLFHDLIPFFLISFFVVIAFSAAIHATLLHSTETSKDQLYFSVTIFGMVKYYSALEDAQTHDSSREKEFAKVVLTVYGIISVVLLINMLIAAMNKTYEIVCNTKTDLVARQRLAILLLLERRLPFECVRKRSQRAFDYIANRQTGKMDIFLKVFSKKC